MNWIAVCKHPLGPGILFFLFVDYTLDLTCSKQWALFYVCTVVYVCKYVCMYVYVLILTVTQINLVVISSSSSSSSSLLLLLLLLLSSVLLFENIKKDSQEMNKCTIIFCFSCFRWHWYSRILYNIRTRKETICGTWRCGCFSRSEASFDLWAESDFLWWRITKHCCWSGQV